MGWVGGSRRRTVKKICSGVQCLVLSFRELRKQKGGVKKMIRVRCFGFWCKVGSGRRIVVESLNH